MKLKNCFTALAGILLLGSVGLFTRGMIERQNELSRQFSEAQLKSATELTAVKVEKYLSGNMNAVNAIAEIYARNNTKPSQDADLREAVKKLMKEMNFSDINFCDISGTGLDLDNKEIKAGTCPYFQKALLGESTIGFSKFYQGSKNIDIIYTVPILEDSKIISVLRVSMKLDNLQKIISIDTFRGEEEVYLLTKDGNILSDLSGSEGKTKNFFSLLKIDKDTLESLSNAIQQGKTLFTVVDGQNSKACLSYTGLNNLSDGGIMISIPENKLKEMFGRSGSDQLLYILIVMVVGNTMFLVGGTLTEATKRKRVEGLAYYDDTIDSISYNCFKKDACELLHKSNGANYAVIQVAIDRFEYIREFFGEQEVLHILKHVARIFHGNLKPDELYSRLNSDYFILLLKYHSKEELTDRINYLNNTIKSIGDTEIQFDKYEFNLRYGIYCINKEDTNLDIMVNKAKHVLSLIKNRKGQYMEFYSGEMQDKIIDENEIVEHMHQALEDKEFLVYLQPKFELSSGKQAGAEALVRWMHPEKGFMYPNRFISTFEKNGFIVKLDLYMLDVVCNTLKEWIGKGYRPMPLSVNISRLNLFDTSFVNNIEATLEKYGVPANLIELEIAEKVVTDNMEILSSLITRLKKDGFLISMDDFGTGTTSMNTIYQVHVDELKLDQKFLGGAEKTDRGISIIKSIIDTAKRLNIKVVSEGVENKAQARLLKELGCDMVQGFVFSDPLPIHEYEKYAYGSRTNENRLF